MGSTLPHIVGKYLQQSKTEHLLLALAKLRRLFHSQLIVLGIEGLLLGYYMANVYLLCQQNMSEEKVVCPKCPECKKQSFQVVCKKTGKVLSCSGCYAKMTECPQCFQTADREHEVIRLYLA